MSVLPIPDTNKNNQASNRGRVRNSNGNRRGKHVISVKNLLVACEAQSIQEAFEKSTWQLESKGTHSKMKQCHLCSTPHKYFVVVRNLYNGIRLTVGNNCYEKIMRFSLHGDFSPLPYTASTKKKLKESHQRLLSRGEHVIAWLNDQPLPDNLRREIEYVKCFDIPSSIENSEALNHYYKHHRFLTVKELFNFQQIDQAREMGINLYSMTIAQAEEYCEIIDMFSYSQIRLGHHLDLEMSTLNHEKAAANLALLENFGPNALNYIEEFDLDVSDMTPEKAVDIKEKIKALSLDLKTFIKRLQFDVNAASAKEVKQLATDVKKIFFSDDCVGDIFEWEEKEFLSLEDTNRSKSLSFKISNQGNIPIDRRLREHLVQNLPDVVTNDDEISQRYQIAGNQEVQESIELTLDIALIRQNAEKQHAIDDFYAKLADPSTEIKVTVVNEMIGYNVFDLVLTDDNENSVKCQIMTHRKDDMNICKALEVTRPKDLVVKYDPKYKSLHIDSKQAKEWKTKAWQYMRAEAKRVAALVRFYDVIFEEDKPHLTTYHIRHFANVWLHVSALKLQNTQIDHGLRYNYFKASVEIRVPQEKAGQLIGKDGENIRNLQFELENYFRVRHLRVKVVPRKLNIKPI